MVKGINLLKGKKSQDYIFETSVKKFSIVCFVLLGAYLIFGTGLLIFWFDTKSQANKTNQLIEARKQQITQLKPTEYSLQALKQQLAFFDSVSSVQNADFVSILEMFFGLEKDGITLESISITNKGNVAISGKASQSFELADFIKSLEDNNKSIKSAFLKSLSREKDGAYKFETDMSIVSN